MEEVLRNTEGNNSFFYIFMAVLVVLAIGRNLFKKNISFLFSDNFETSVDNAFLFIFCGILLFTMSGGLFFNSIFQKFHFEWIVKITPSKLTNNILVSSIFCFLFVIFRFVWARIAFFVLGVNPNTEFYFLLRLRYILFLSFTLLILGILIKYMNINDLNLEYLLVSVSFVVFLGFMFALYKRLIYLNRHTDIPLYYIILYLCTLEILPLLVVSKILINSIKL
ncbi:MAG: DUF4271 domain-containing protein [Flavobacteriales bacterium]